MSQDVVNVLVRSESAKSKAKRTNTFRLTYAHCFEDMRHAVYACAASAAGRGLDLQGIQQHDEAIAVSTGERDVQVGRQARLSGIDHRVINGGKDSCLLYTSPSPRD